jgi:hypothetical protein
LWDFQRDSGEGRRENGQVTYAGEQFQDEFWRRVPEFAPASAPTQDDVLLVKIRYLLDVLTADFAVRDGIGSKEFSTARIDEAVAPVAGGGAENNGLFGALTKVGGKNRKLSRVLGEREAVHGQQCSNA